MVDLDYHGIGERLAHLRIGAGLSAADVAGIVHTRTHIIRGVELGLRMPSIEMVIYLAGVGGVPVDWIVFGEAHRPPDTNALDQKIINALGDGFTLAGKVRFLQ